jgi:hypothetical protein
MQLITLSYNTLHTVHNQHMHRKVKQGTDACLAQAESKDTRYLTLVDHRAPPTRPSHSERLT